MNHILLAWEVLDKVKATSSRKSKEGILREARANSNVDTILQDFFWLLMDPYVNFGVNVDIDVTDLPARDYNSEEALRCWDTLRSSLDLLAKREVTGNAARDLVCKNLYDLGQDIGRWAIPMVRKTAKFGVAANTVNKVWPDLIRGFDCQLAKAWDGVNVPEQAIVEPKYDGVRGLLFFGKDPKAFSRNGKPLNNVGHILGELSNIYEGYVLDGEFFSEDWASSVSAVRSKESGKTDARFRIFDMVSVSEWTAQNSTTALVQRLGELKNSFDAASVGYATLTPHLVVEDANSVHRATRAYIEQGFEGGVMKDLDAPYCFGRNASWQKIKETHTVDLPVVDFQEGSGRLAGSLGALVVELEGPEGPLRCGVGSGLTDAMRQHVWTDQSKYRGLTAEVAYQEKTPDGALRFPVFMRWRSDK